MGEQEPQQKNNSIRAWLRRIFTNTRVIMALTIISTIAGVVGAVAGFKSCMSDRPSQISLKYYDSFGEGVCVDDKNLFVNLRAFASHSVNYDQRTELSNPICNGFPTIENITSKSIKDIRIDIIITCGELTLEERHINPEFEIVEHDQCNTIRLRYKPDILPPHASVPFPFYALTWASNADSLDGENPVYFKYEISYDGIDKIRDFCVIDYLAFGYKDQGDFRFLDIKREQRDFFLTHCYDSGFFTVQKKRTLVAIIQSNVRKIIPPRTLSDKDFEQFKQLYMF